MIKHVYSMWQFNRGEIERIIEGARDILENFLTRPRRSIPDLSKDIHLLMEEKSTRTVTSFFTATKRLGYLPLFLSGDATSLGKGETLYRTGKMFSLYGSDMFITRTGIEGAQKFIAQRMEERKIPTIVFNAGDGTNEHPTQALLDMATIKIKKGRIDGLKIAMVGDLKYSRVAHSLSIGLSRFKNIALYLLSDKDTELPLQYQNLFKKVIKVKNLKELAAAGCDVVAHFRLQEERFAGNPTALRRKQKSLMITEENIATFGPNCIFIHPQPYLWEYSPNLPEKDPRIIIDFQVVVGLAVRIFLVQEAFKNQHKPAPVFPETKIVKKILERMTIAEYRKKKRKTGNSKINLIAPIKTEGVVIDHLREGSGRRVWEFLLANGILRREARLTEGVKSKKYGAKDMIILEKSFIPEELMMSISLFDPQTTFCLIGSHFTKIRIAGPKLAIGFGKCLNDNCITNKSAGECDSRFTSYERKRNLFRCDYCHNTYTRKEIFGGKEN